MLSEIANDNELRIWKSQFEQVQHVLKNQKSLLPDAQVSDEILFKLVKLHDYLKGEIGKYNKLNRV